MNTTFSFNLDTVLLIISTSQKVTSYFNHNALRDTTLHYANTTLRQLHTQLVKCTKQCITVSVKIIARS